MLLSVHFDRLLYWSALSVPYAPLPTRSPCLINWRTNPAKGHVTAPCLTLLMLPVLEPADRTHSDT